MVKSMLTMLVFVFHIHIYVHIYVHIYSSIYTYMEVHIYIYVCTYMCIWKKNSNYKMMNSGNEKCKVS